ncbi:MAG: hypothetical protein UR28_C0010G0020 [Candidatus Peregrinibacteria bacterium GW2011_GWF2_33_10]|nr:MAG: hypothetical protein UR28_C0010G0020 [Candidatus Peregrinibacteria bacterium GW2011_GWF2_33_10]OGJ46129.1 MAG: 50S ribosomal protein L29 [Candidatus Peregrinibacteria bacterium RIFOXYA12_FULL_33_12]OGJ46165.1 MAG: 50S ribosomal protein L29 [Candidatus Peregrinibacteria bacterium RIFOXYA2_FULL_33_21]OGJ51582.1 MAG: 50S ribosomal protein L29 [Candidatus Peregrinibacteria bacterium RIFOXYB2_FULL_33_20]
MLSNSELKLLGQKDLFKLGAESSRELLKLTLAAKSGQLKANHKIKELKKYIARINTFLN